MFIYELTWLAKNACSMLVACGICLQKLCLHSWGMVNSFMSNIISIVVTPCSLALAEQEERRGESKRLSQLKDLWRTVTKKVSHYTA